MLNHTGRDREDKGEGAKPREDFVSHKNTETQRLRGASCSSHRGTETKPLVRDLDY